jgi:hypothetical protein
MKTHNILASIGCITGKVAAGALFVIGVLSCLMAFGSQIIGSSSTLRWPLGAAWDVVVDELHGSIYVVTSYGRVQKYDATGRFMRGWPVGKSVMLEWDKSDGTLVVVRKARSTMKFDAGGDLVREWMEPGRYEQLSQRTLAGGTGIRSFTDFRGNLYRGKGAFWPTIVRMDPDGNEYTIIRDPVWLWCLNMPYPGLLVLVPQLMVWSVRMWPGAMARPSFGLAMHGRY